MIRTILIYLSILFVIIACKKENEDYSTVPNNYPIINIDSLEYSYIDEDTNYFYQGNFSSIKHIAKFNIQLLEGKFYRFYASQKYSNKKNISLSLINNSGDTISTSQTINGENILLFNANKDYELILQAQLQSDENVSLDYRIFFEERQYKSFSYLNHNWQSYGRFDKTTNAFKFVPSHSNRHRWLMLDSEISNLSSIEYNIELLNQTNINNISFAFAEKLNSNNYNSDPILSNGLYYSIEESGINAWQILNCDSVLIQQQNASNWNANSFIINVKIENNSGELLIYLNQNLSFTVNSDFTEKFFYIYLNDRSESENIIKYTEVINN